MEAKRIYDGVYLLDGMMATVNLARGSRVYGEQLVEADGVEYRMWTPYRSKLSAAIKNGLKTMEIRQGLKVLYLGAANGTTASHVSDIVGKLGSVYCVEFSERSMRDLLSVCSRRANMLPILADASCPESYADIVGECDAIYQDVSARNQVEILERNSRFLKGGGYAYFVIKSQSIDISRPPAQVFSEALKKLAGNFEIMEKVDLEPYDSMHMFAVLRKR